MANRGRVSKWYSPNELTELIKTLKKGDLVEFYRNVLYNHWAVYAGMRYVKGKKVACVIHVASPGDATSFNVMFRSQCCQKQKSGHGNVEICPLIEVASESQVRINNGNDKKETPGTEEEILQRAKRFIEYGKKEYNIFSNNCEHFANYCRYGKKKSDQVEHMTTNVFVGGAILLALGAGITFIARPTGVRRVGAKDAVAPPPAKKKKKNER